MYSSFPQKILFCFLSIAVFFCTASPANAQGYGPSDPAELESFLDAYITEQMDAHHIPGVVITFVKDGEVFLSKGYGYADIQK